MLSFYRINLEDSGSDRTRNFLNQFGILLEELFEARRSISKALSQARDSHFDAQLFLRQVQERDTVDTRKNLELKDENEEFSDALWCQNFHKQRLLTLELREKVNHLLEENLLARESDDKKERQMKEILTLFKEKYQSVSGTSQENSTEENFASEHDFASIAVQTVDFKSAANDPSTSRYMTENTDVLGQAITDLEKQKALNENLQRALREKELTLISKDQFINQVKSNMSFYKYDDARPNSSDQLLKEQRTVTSPFDKQELEHLKTKVEEGNRTIFRYQMLLEKAHKEQQEESNRYKIEIGSVIRERDNSLRKVKELQLCLDSIPCRDGDSNHQQTTLVEQVQSMSETIRLLEKQLSTCRIENSELESRMLDSERELSIEKQRSRVNKEKQEIACQLKSKNMEQENKHLLEELNQYKIEIAKNQSHCEGLEKKVSESPSPILVALIEKMREKLIDKDKYIALLEEKQQMKSQEQN